MSSIHAFICELIRAANEVEKLTPREMSRLLDRSVDTIRDLRGQTEIAGSRRARDVLIDFANSIVAGPRPFTMKKLAWSSSPKTGAGQAALFQTEGRLSFLRPSNRNHIAQVRQKLSEHRQLSRAAPSDGHGRRRLWDL